MQSSGLNCMYNHSFYSIVRRAKFRKATLTFVMSVCPPQRITRLPLQRFSWNLIFKYFLKICRENSSFVKICEEYRVRYTKIWYDIFVNCNWIYTRWQCYSTHIHTNNTYNNTNNNRTTQITTNLEECRPCPVFVSFTLAFALQLSKNHGKPSVRVAEEENASIHITKTPTPYKTSQVALNMG